MEGQVITLLESRISELEFQLEQQGWLRLETEGGREFRRDVLDRLIEQSRTYYLKNPLIKRAVDVGALYVWGQDVTVGVEDEEVRLVVDRFWRDNRSVLTGQQASRLLEVELQVTGNVFFALFPDRVSGQVRVRGIPVEEIREIVTNPEDRSEVWFYRRVWTTVPLSARTAPVRYEAYYPDWRYWEIATDRIEQIDRVPVIWDIPVCHVKVGAFPHWRWGVPEVYAALDWAKAYKELLEDDATRSRALARFAWQISTKGGKKAIEAVKQKLSTTLGVAAGTGVETNPPPVVGSAAVMGEGVTLDPIRIAGTTLPADHARPARLMAASALGLPDTFFGDVDQGTLATARSLDRPTELRYSERRQLWRDVLTELIQWAIDRDLASTSGILAGETLDDERRVVNLSWPDILERDVRERVAAVVDAATLSGRQLAPVIAPETVSRLLLTALGVEDVDAEVERAFAGVEESLTVVDILKALSGVGRHAVNGTDDGRP